MHVLLKKYGSYVLPLVFIVVSGFFAFFILRTCISFFELVELFLLSTAFCFAAFYLLAKKYELFIFEFFNAIVLLVFVPLLMSVFLGINFYVSKPVFKETVPIIGNVKADEELRYVIKHKNAPPVCRKLFKLQDDIDMQVYTKIETQINKGLFDYYVLRYQTTY